MVKEDEEWRKVDFSKVPKLKAVFQKENGMSHVLRLCISLDLYEIAGLTVILILLFQNFSLNLACRHSDSS